MIGFEIEISLPVTDQHGALIAGDEKLGRSQVRPLKIVTDKRSLPAARANVPGNPYSNIEFVTDAVSVIGTQVNAGLAAVLNQLAEIRRIRDNFYNAGAVALPNACDQVTYTAVGTTAQLAPGNGYFEHAGRPGMGDGLFVHYSIGIPLRSFGAFLNVIRAGAPIAQGVPLPRARFRLAQAVTFADAVVGDFRRSRYGRQAQDTRALHGYLQLAFTQVCAMADYLAAPRDAGQIKNGTVVLSRSMLSEVFALLGEQERGYLAQAVQLDDTDQANPITRLAGLQERTETRGQILEFQDNGSRQVRPDTPEIRLIDYATAAFAGDPDIEQQHVFGGMRQISPEDEEGVTLIPVELRTLGAQMKSWADVQVDLTNLCAAAEQARQNA